MKEHVFVRAKSPPEGAIDLSPELPVGDSYLVVLPSNDRFNDFGTVSRIELRLYRWPQLDMVPISGKMLLAEHNSPVVASDTNKILQSLDSSNESALVPIRKALDKFRFVSVLNDQDEYQKLIEAVGADTALSLLSEMNDVGYLNLKKPDDYDLRWFQGRPEYGQALLRSDRTFIAAYDLQSHLLTNNRRTSGDPVSAAYSSLTHGEIRFDFSPDALGTNRLSVIIGENGVGKSRILRAIAKQMHEAGNGPVVFIPSPLDETAAIGDLPAAVIQEHPATQHGWSFMTRMVTSLMRDQTAGPSNFRLLSRAVSSFMDLDCLALPLRDTDRSVAFSNHESSDRLYALLPSIRLRPEGQKTEVYGLIDLSLPPALVVDGQLRLLSSGERALFGMATAFIQRIPRGGIVLLDEPELSLHPRMIADLIRLLGLLLEERNARCVIATHSLYVVRETPSTSVHVLKRDEDGSVSDLEPMIQTLGSGLTELSNVIFDDWNIREYFEDRIAEFLNKPRTPEELLRTSDQLGEIARAALMDIYAGRQP